MEILQANNTATSLLDAITEELGMKQYVITDVKTNQKGEGYLGQIFLVTIKDANSDQRLDLVVKSAFTNAKAREVAPIGTCFINEIIFYTDVYPVFQKFAQERAVPSGSPLAPKCWKVSAKDQDEALVLDNLKAFGFEIFDKTLTLDEDHVKLIFRTYGRFHAYSFALRDQKPEEYERVTKKFHNIYAEFITNEMFTHFLVENHRYVHSAFVPEEDEEIAKKYAANYDGNKIVEVFHELATEEVEFSAILHGDCWSNNMMFKYEDAKDGKRPTDMRLIDWQLMKVGSPVCDLSYCLYSGASKTIFDNLNDYLKIYHDSFSAFLRELGSDPDELYPFSVLEEQWKRHSKFGLIMSLPIIKMKLTDQADIIDLTDADGISMDEVDDILAQQRFDEEGYRERIRGLLWHMSELGAL